MSDTERLFQLAEKSLLEGNSEKSLQILISLNSESLTIQNYLRRSELLSKIKLLDKAEEDLTIALAIVNKDFSFKKKYLRTILSARSTIRESQEKYSEALEDSNYLYELTKESAFNLNSQRLLKMDKESKLKKEAGEFLMIFKMNLEIKPGSEWHIVSSSWFEKWQRYVKLSSFYMQEEIPFKLFTKSSAFCSHPGQIDNSDIIDQEESSIILEDPENPYTKTCLKKGIVENLNYQLLPTPAFEFLNKIYNCSTDIKRFAIEVNDTMYQVEVYLKAITIASSKQDQLETNLFNISRKSTIDSLKKTYNSIKKITSPTKVWKVSLAVLSLEKLQAFMSINETIYLEGAKVLSENLLIDDAEIGEQDLLLVEISKNNKFRFTDDSKKISARCGFCQSNQKLLIVCQKCRVTKYCSLVCQNKHLGEHKDKCKPRKMSFLHCFCRNSLSEHSDEDQVAVVPAETIIRYKSGLIGLQNLGNTCFMNAAIQCLSHTNEITEVFLSGKYLEYLNKSNPLGTNGKLAGAYAELLESLWKGTSNSVAPWKMKRIISSYAPQFVGYQQHDSQELLGFILDRIHEDLNLIKKKPYFEDNDNVGKDDSQMAEESWKRHVMRNQSIIVDLMHGQYKSSLHCPSCKKYSYTFDPFNSITLPLPQSQEKIQNCYFIFYDSSKAPFSLSFEYFKEASLDHAGKEISKLLEIPLENFIFATITNDIIKEILNLKKLIDSLKNFTLFAYQLREGISGVMIEVQVEIEKGRSRSTSYSRLVNVQQNINFKELHLEVFQKFKIYLPKFANKARSTENYEEFMVNPAYILYFASTKDLTCQFCLEKTCKGCPVPYSNEKIRKILGKDRIILELIWKANHSSLGANLQELNRCTEHTSVTEITQKSRKNPVKLQECFDLFRVPEQLEKENAWYCPNCKTHVQATKKLEIYKAPPILIIHIKRFKVTGHTKEKLYNPVIFPEKGLDISDWVIGTEVPKLYDLYAVCNHFGNLTGGHYTATCYSTLNKSWFDFNDSQVVPTSENTSASAYVLFYRSRI